MIKITYSSKFLKSFKNLPKNIQKVAVRKIELFEKEPFSTSLKTHKLTGNLDEFYPLSISYHYRILFKFEDDKEASFMNVGTHSIYS